MKYDFKIRKIIKRLNQVIQELGDNELKSPPVTSCVDQITSSNPLTQRSRWDHTATVTWV